MAAPSALLTVDEHLSALGSAVERLTADAARAGLEAPVPTCPGWTVRDLLAHQGMVHRWAAANVIGDPEWATNPDPLEVEGRNHPDPVDWVREGGADLLSALRDAPDDLEALVFLREAPPPRQFWARRQCHETTIHAVDALAAREGGPPPADRTAIAPALAADGIDELLTGFLTRRTSTLRTSPSVRILVAPRDLDLAWLVTITNDPAVTTRHTSAAAPEADVRWGGTAADLYLGLWNRGELHGDPAAVALWRKLAQISW